MWMCVFVSSFAYTGSKVEGGGLPQFCWSVFTILEQEFHPTDKQLRTSHAKKKII